MHTMPWIDPGDWISWRYMTWGTGPFNSYWERLQMVAWTGGYYGVPFHVDRCVRQGYPLLPNILNIVVDAVVRHWE